MKKPAQLLPALIVLGVMLQGMVAQACVGCREPGSDTVAKESPTVMAGLAFSWSVLFMLGFVLLMVGGMSFYIWQTCRRLARENPGT
jgi:hypothetical protein